MPTFNTPWLEEMLEAWLKAKLKRKIFYSLTDSHQSLPKKKAIFFEDSHFFLYKYPVQDVHTSGFFYFIHVGTACWQCGKCKTKLKRGLWILICNYCLPDLGIPVYLVYLLWHTSPNFSGESWIFFKSFFGQNHLCQLPSFINLLLNVANLEGLQIHFLVNEN